LQNGLNHFNPRVFRTLKFAGVSFGVNWLFASAVQFEDVIL
jgi:hypothetical protein